MPVAIRLESFVVKIDPDSATVGLEGGESIQGDLVLAADGALVRLMHGTKFLDDLSLTRVAVGNSRRALSHQGWKNTEWQSCNPL